MPTATLTWSAPHGESALQSTFSATAQGFIQLANQYFTALAAFADFPWEVCSFQGTTAPWYVTLKRKNGAPGRIVFIGVTTAPSTTYNPQLGLNLWSSAATARAAFFRNATSDTPANILATSGDVFTDPSESTGGCATLAVNSGAYNMMASACEDGVFLKYGTPTSTANAWFVGDLLEDNLGAQWPVSAALLSGVLTIAPITSPNTATTGGVAIRAGTTYHFGTGFAPPAILADHLRDLGTKESWFHPLSTCCLQLPKGQQTSYKLRQIAYGPTPIAAYEQLTATGGVLKAISTNPTTTAGLPWLVNFKV